MLINLKPQKTSQNHCRMLSDVWFPFGFNEGISKEYVLPLRYESHCSQLLWNEVTGVKPHEDDLWQISLLHGDQIEGPFETPIFCHYFHKKLHSFHVTLALRRIMKSFRAKLDISMSWYNAGYDDRNCRFSNFSAGFVFSTKRPVHLKLMK